MFWEVWRNVSTPNWGFGNPNKKDRQSSKMSVYDKLASSSSSVTCGSTGPKKSASQPSNITRLLDNDECDEDFAIPTLDSSHIAPSSMESNTEPGNERSLKKSNVIKRSISSFLPFTTCSPFGTSVKPEIRQDPQSTGTVKQSENRITETESISLDQNKTGCTISGNNAGGGDQIIDYWDDEGHELPTCDVCSRAFPTIRQLAAHQRKKRHYGCIQCDSIFPSREVLECHREQMCHYEFAIDMYSVDEGKVGVEDEFFESEDEASHDRLRGEDDNLKWDDEELERLL